MKTRARELSQPPHLIPLAARSLLRPPNLARSPSLLPPWPLQLHKDLDPSRLILPPHQCQSFLLRLPTSPLTKLPAEVLASLRQWLPAPASARGQLPKTPALLLLLQISLNRIVLLVRVLHRASLAQAQVPARLDQVLRQALHALALLLGLPRILLHLLQVLTHLMYHPKCLLAVV